LCRSHTGSDLSDGSILLRPIEWVIQIQILLQFLPRWIVLVKYRVVVLGPFFHKRNFSHILWLHFFFSYAILNEVAIYLNIIVLFLGSIIVGSPLVFFIFRISSEFVDKCFLIRSDRLLIWEKSTSGRPKF
jgi:hypothetical protein